MMRRTGFLTAISGFVVLIASISAMGQVAANKPADGPIMNWRGDGTGLFPNANPVTEWGKWPKSPSWGLKYSTSRPAKDDDSQKAVPVKSEQIMEWLVAGPFTAKDPAKVLDEDLLGGEDKASPDAGEKVGDVEWKKHLSVTKDAGVEMDWVQLANVAGKGPGNVAYAHNYLYSKVKGSVIFLTDQTGACKMWINGKLVHTNPKPVVTMGSINYVCYAAGEHWAGELPIQGPGGSQKIKVDLEQGWNRVLIKSTGNINMRIMEAPETTYETKNILWATPLPNYSNAQPIMVGDKIFVMSESEDLICLDKHTGKILWKKGTYYTDCLSDEEKQSNPLLKQAAELTERLRNTTDSGERVKVRNEIKKALMAADKKAKEEDPAYKDIRPLQEKLKDKDLPDAERKVALDQIRALLQKMEGPKEANPYYAVVVPLEAAAKAKGTKEEDRAGILAKIDETLTKAAPQSRFLYHFHSHIWATGFTCPTPRTDGKNIYVYLGWGIVACYDLDGNRKWASLATDLGGDGIFNNSAPVLAGGRFMIVRNVQMRGYDAATGKVVWTTPDLRPEAGVDVWHGFGTGGNPSASPAVVKIGQTEVAFFNGALVGVADGKVYRPWDNFASNPRGTPVVLNNSIYYGVHSSIVRFAIPTEVSVGMKLDRAQQEKYDGEDTYSSVLVHDGLVYALRANGNLFVYDAATLANVYTQKLDMDSYSDYDHPGVTPSLVLGGKYVFAFDNQGNCIVIEPGRTFKQVARNSIATRVWRNWVLDPDEIFQAAPIFDEGRMYLRGETALYCIGTK